MAVEVVCSAPHMEIVSAALHLHGRMTVPEISRVTGLSKSAVHRALLRLERTDKVSFEPLWSAK
jgi:DNA-binding IclR family transcriptional regulator